MDVDLQDPPSLLPEMWKILHDPESDYDCVATRRTTRKGEHRFALFLLAFSIGSLMNCQIQRLWMAPEIIA